ncbi:MAG TPA: CBS domain-containing protein, partial [Stellaceae bacterium]|nr:CBS domain-containing protein [Stellaceae bacterium]
MSIAAITNRRPRRTDGIAVAAASRTAKQWRATLVRDSATIRDAIRAIDDSALQIALVMDGEQRLVGTVTDGDVRRGLLRGITLDAAAADIMNRRPASCPAA